MRGAGDVVDDVGDVAGAVDAGAARAGCSSMRDVEYAASRTKPSGHRASQRPPPPARGDQHQQRPRPGRTPAVLSSRWPPAKIQNPSGAGPPMSHEQWSSRPSAGTIPGAPFGRDQGDQADHDQRPHAAAPAVTAHGQPNRRRSSTRQHARRPGRTERRRAASRPRRRPGTRRRRYVAGCGDVSPGVGPQAQTGGSTTSPPGTGARSRPRVTSTGLVRQRIEPPPLWNSETSTSSTAKPQSSSCVADPVGAGRHHHGGRALGRRHDDGVGAERGQRLLLGEHQRLGHQVEQRLRPTPRRARPGRPSRGGSSSGQKARSRWYIPGWVIRSPRTRTPRSVARCLSAELLGARAVADDQRVAERERVAGLEVRADAVAADVRRRRSRARRTTAAPSRSPSGAGRSACATSRRADPSSRTRPRPRFIA